MTWRTDNVMLEDGQAVALRVYGPESVSSAVPLVFHLHGGSFLQSNLDHGELTATLLATAGAVVVAPEYCADCDCAFPRSLETAFDALRGVHKHRAQWAKKSSKFFVAGDEAGGNLAAGLALMARDQHGPELSGQILLSPMLSPALATDSARCANAGPATCQWAKGWAQYLGTADKAPHPYAAPGNATRLGGLPATLIITAQDDPMRDESISYAKRLRDAGVTVEGHVLSAPTGWPCALAERSGLGSSWAEAVRESVSDFLNANGAQQRQQIKKDIVGVLS